MTEKVTFKISDSSNYQLLEFEIDGGIITSDDLPDVEAPKLNTTKGVIISGRGPVWLFVYLAHLFHPHPWIATYEPRTNSAVICSTHSATKVGDTIPDILKL